MALDFFVAGPGVPVPGLFDGLLPAWPAGLARHFIEAYTHPDAVVLDPFAVDDLALREGTAAGRRMIATNSNPLVALLLRQRLSPPEPAALKSAATRLGDTFKRGLPLRELLQGLYRTHCPGCRHPAVADYFVWSREPADPRQKWVACPACGQAGLAAVDEEDLRVLDEVETRGLHYWYLFNRVVAATGDDARAYVEALMELYTPRAIYAVANLLMRIEATFEEDARLLLKGALLHVLGPAGSLYAPDAAGRATLTPGDLSNVQVLVSPARFVEWNVWRAFEAAVERLAAYAAGAPRLPLQPDLHWVTRLPSSPQGLAWVHNLGAGAVGRGLPPESVSLVLSIPPRPNPVFWSLSYVWSGWLLGPEEAAKLRGLALQKWPDWTWYQSAMSAALRALRPALRFDGRGVFALRDSPPQQVFALVLAALEAGYEIESWQYRAGDEHRLVLAPTPRPAPRPEEPEALHDRVVSGAGQAAAAAVIARGEPMATERLQIAAWHHLMQAGVLDVARASLPAGRVLSWLSVAIGQGLEAAGEAELAPVPGEAARPAGWWLRKAVRGVAPPLSDRVEEAVLAELRAAEERGGGVAEAALSGELYRRFGGPLAPGPGLVRACLDAYGQEVAPGYWRLRPHEVAVLWQARAGAAIQDLLALGERLGYRAAPGGAGVDVVWEEEGPWATFEWAPTAHVARFLPHAADLSPPADLRWRHLVIPAARAGLWEHKLASQPWLAATIEAGRWTFIKLEHLQALAAREDVSLHDLKAIVGLVPPVESGAGQLPLF
jgi:hypothetical protein